MTAIEVASLSKRFGKTQALDGVSLSVENGEMVALIGASGSGKSTLIRHIAGLERGSRGGGRIDVLGRPMQAGGRLGPDVRTLRRDIGVIFQQFNLVNRLPLLTNVLIGALGGLPAWRGTLGLFPKDRQHQAMEALERVDMAARARQRASTLSGGQQQRAAIARALVQGAKVILADEPIASLDPASAKRVMETLKAINADGITVVVSLHQVQYAQRYCERTVALRDGRVVFDGASSALTPAFLRELYGEASDELILPDAEGERAPAPASPAYA